MDFAHRAWLLAFFSMFPEYSDVCGLSLKGPNWLIYTSQRAKSFSKSIYITSENLHTRDSKFSPDQRVLGLGQSQSWYQQQLSPRPGCLRVASVVYCHQGHLGTQTKDNVVIYWPLIICPSHMLEGVSSLICPSLASSDQIMKLSIVICHHTKSN